MRLCLERDDPADFSLGAPSLGIVGMESCWEVYKIFPGVDTPGTVYVQ